MASVRAALLNYPPSAIRLSASSSLAATLLVVLLFVDFLALLIQLLVQIRALVARQ